ncbi:MAG: AAA family ATPase [Candidatus Electrothrix communis]|nr:MAG: AAA family ATPase [Candidatus Electrothrix communis]
MQKLPIGIQTFTKIREEEYRYVDKTKIAFELINNGNYYFLSRPRRFGKSLFLSTLQAIFEGRKDLFHNLYIHDVWDWQTTYPVVKISFAGVARNVAAMQQDIKNILKDNQDRLNIDCLHKEDTGGCLRELIRKSFEKYQQKVVILVDEYDKLILDNLDQLEVAQEAREILKDLYATIKDCDEYIKFAFFTGVSKFAKVSVFSGLNNLSDISLDSRYATICGYTQDDLVTVFADLLRDADMERVRDWYNGYNFLGEKVYNPFDILLFIDKGLVFNNYWFETGTPTFLLKLIRQNNYFLPRLSDLRVDSSLLDGFDIDHIRLEPVLFQAGYLTIKEVHELEFGGFEYTLHYPNREVALSFNDALIRFLTDATTYTPTKTGLFSALKSGDVEALKDVLISLFASIPYNNYVKNTVAEYEGYYASVIYAYLASLGIRIIAEDVTNTGRIDLTLFLGDNIYIVEFKVDGNADPLEQIKERKYAQKYAGQGIVYLVGILFSSTKKNIETFSWERV